ncbi:hypothetical protein CAPTEDRAFT_220661 [Capitella teleta]|uniref:Uncharacterized protein n=1 Tax=Capitella teleta TaxID=283909 RepID=R7UPU4_CAPTE|nr:hypothetical protein CAPTEDRAFT_220661 [Capitella teleta]|eukprot:ELU05967.1 hypothetical protein CAPTEDRAFT_220661 [Capitella teleta]
MAQKEELERLRRDEESLSEEERSMEEESGSGSGSGSDEIGSGDDNEDEGSGSGNWHWGPRDTFVDDPPVDPIARNKRLVENSDWLNLERSAPRSSLMTDVLEAIVLVDASYIGAQSCYDNSC